MQSVRFSLSGHSAWWLRLFAIGLGLGCLVLLESPSPWTSGPIALAQQDNVSYETEMQEGRALLRRHRYEEALKSFKRANEMRDKKSAECLLWMAQAYQGLEAYKNVVESCDRAIELGASDNLLRAQAFNLKGIALESQAKGEDQKKLQEAEVAFRQGLAVNVDFPTLHYGLGFVLLQQGRDPEGIAELKKYVELRPKAADADDARKLIENPRRARENFAPDFAVTTGDGEHIALEDLRGKVVLLDFWGTWCPPCVASVPSLRDLHKRYAKEKSFVMIGISSDAEEEKWRAFTTRNQMVWPQYWDRDRRLQRAFEVRAFPTYIVIDHEGIVQYRTSGLSFEREAKLADVIRKQVKILAKTAPSH